MRAAVCCPGPSLDPDRVRRGGFEVVIGVNRAVEAVRCDWWCFGDPQPFGWFQPVGEPPPALAVGPNCLKHVLAEPWAKRFKVAYRGEDRTQGLAWAELGRRPAGRGWMTFSFTAAIVLAANFGARRIDCFGADLAGETDFAGRWAERRDEKRWPIERYWLAWTLSWIRRQTEARVARHGVRGRRSARASSVAPAARFYEGGPPSAVSDQQETEG